MEKKRTVQRRSGKKRGRPRVKFNFWVLVIIFVLSFLACFMLYMLAANFNDNFFEDEFDSDIVDVLPDEELPGGSETSDDASDQAEQEQSGAEKAITNPVPQSAAADASYLDSCTLITDATLINMAKYDGIKDVIGSSELNALNCNETKVVSSYGTVTVYDTIKIKKPTNIYIMLGSDLGTSSVDEMIASYTTLVTNLHSALPDMKIFIMQVPPVIYDTETLSNELINDYNNRLLALANSAGVYCIDTNTALKSGSGVLDEAYWSYEELALSAEGYNAVCGYILTHTP